MLRQDIPIESNDPSVESISKVREIGEDHPHAPRQGLCFPEAAP